MTPKCECGIPYTYVCTKDIGDQYWDYYICTKCNTPTHDVRYKYDPTSCPKHVTEHLGVEFKDDAHCHQLYQVDRCVRCGAIRKTPRDTRQAGFSGRNEIDDPKVINRLLLNQSVWERLAPKEIQELQTVKLPEYPTLPREADL